MEYSSEFVEHTSLMGARSRLFVLLVIAMFCSSCSMLSVGESPKMLLKDYNPSLPSLQKVKFEIPKKELDKALAATPAAGEVRLVELLHRRGEAKPYPEYRIFGISRNSAYALLGLQDADVIFAANGFVMFDSTKFPQFVHLLKDESFATIHLRREGRPYQYEYVFVDNQAPLP